MKKKKGKTPKFIENDKFEHCLGIESTESVYNNRFNDDYYRYGLYPLPVNPEYH